jgi:hypothetical protein
MAQIDSAAQIICILLARKQFAYCKLANDVTSPHETM